MAGATNRAFKAAGIPRKAAAEIRLKAGGRLTLKSALDVAAKHGIDVPQKAHDFAAQRDRKAALKTAKARRAANITRALGDAARISRDMRRKAAADAQKVSAGVDSSAKRSKAGAMDVKPRKTTMPGEYEATIRGVRVTIEKTKADYGRPGHRNQFNKKAHWIVTDAESGKLISSGDASMRKAIKSADDALGLYQ